MSTVTELATQVKTNPALMPELWQAVERLIKWYAQRYIAKGAEQGSRLYDFEDLAQAGYLALADAVRTYEATAGMEFTSFLGFHIRRHFAECGGWRGTKKRPEIYADSLDAPISEENDLSRLDNLADPGAEFADDVIEAVAKKQAYAVIMAEMDKLQEQQRQAITLHICEGKTLKEAAAIMDRSPERVRQCEAKGLRMLRRMTKVKAMHYDFYHVSLARYRTTFTSAVEWEVLRREREGYYRGETPTF